MTTEQRITRLEKAIYESIEFGGSLIGSMDDAAYPNAMSIWKELYEQQMKKIKKTNH